MTAAIDSEPYEVVITFRDGRQLAGRCMGNPFAYAPNLRGLFSGPFMLVSDTCVVNAATHEYVPGYTAMIRAEDVLMIQAKKLEEGSACGSN